MKADKPSKNRKRKSSRLLGTVVALLVVALLAVSMLYLRTVSDRPSPSLPASPPPSGTDGTAPGAAAAPQPSSPQPLALFLDLDGSEGALDAVVCDSEGLAVPGYAFPLEIRCPDGSSHSVCSDINGHYYAAYIPGGQYSVSMPPLEGFIPAETVSCTVEPKRDTVTVENFGSFVEDGATEPEGEQDGTAHGAPVEIEGLAEALPPDDGGAYRYRYSVGENGFLLLADGTESDVLPVEERGDLAYGVRMVTVWHLPDGTVIRPEELPEDAVRWTDYYTDEKPVAVPLIFADGAVDERYALRAETFDPSARRSGWVEENGRSYYYAADGRPLSGLQNIDGKLYFFDGSGAKARSLGIDVSYHNSSIDWNAVKAAGIDFAIIRVAFRTWEKGILKEDEDSYRQGKNGGFYLQGAKAAGLKVGVYVYSTAINVQEAVEEAEFAMEIVRRAGVELDLPIYFDTEFSGDYPRGRADRLSIPQRAEIANAFCKTVEDAGQRPGVYSYEDFFHRALRLEDVAGYDLWYASYTRGSALPGYRGFDIWQFTESGRVNGMPDTVDMNVIF